MKFLGQALDSLAQAKQPVGVAIEVLVVANACTDGTAEMLTALAEKKVLGGLPLRWVEEPTPGKSYALNRAVGETEAKALCFLDDDQFVDISFLEAVADALVAYPEYDIICGKLNPAWDGTEPAWVHETGKYRIPIRPFPEYDFGDAPKEITPGHKLPSGGNITVRRRAFDCAGGFSADLGPEGHNLLGGEDLEFLMRCLRHGLRIGYMPTISQLHAIEQERMSTIYMMRKSYLRSLSSVLMSTSHPGHMQRYMVVKPLIYLFLSLLSACAGRRFYYLIRLSAASGELRGVLKRQFTRDGNT